MHASECEWSVSWESQSAGTQSCNDDGEESGDVHGWILGVWEVCGELFDEEVENDEDENSEDEEGDEVDENDEDIED